MAERSRLIISELVEVMRLIADVAAARGDAALQQTLLAQGLQRLVGATVGFAGSCGGWSAAGDPGFVDLHFMTDSTPAFAAYAEQVLKMPLGIRADPYCRTTVRAPGRTVLVTQQAALADSPQDNGAIRAWISQMGAADGMVGIVRLNGPGDRAVAVSMQLLDSRRVFSRRRRALAALAVNELGRLAERGHLSFPLPADDDPAARLSPRQRQLLTLLLTGRHVKGIARDLGLSDWTARDHIKAIYRRLNVTSREELMARLLKPPAPT